MHCKLIFWGHLCTVRVCYVRFVNVPHLSPAFPIFSVVILKDLCCFCSSFVKL